MHVGYFQPTLVARRRLLLPQAWAYMILGHIFWSAQTSPIRIDHRFFRNHQEERLVFQEFPMVVKGRNIFSRFVLPEKYFLKVMLL